jgi:hypothetical protein
MGKGGYLRIQNHSRHDILVKVEERTQVDDIGLDVLQGTIAAGMSFPTMGDNIWGDGQSYQYVEGEKGFFLQSDGALKFSFVALEMDSKTTTSAAYASLHVSTTDWWAGTSIPGSEIVTYTDIEERDDKFRMDIRIFDVIQTSSWMGTMAKSIQHKMLCRVGLPGTHDSGTFQFKESLGASPDSDLTMSIQDKLEGGSDGGRRGLLGSIGSVINDHILSKVFSSLCKTQHKSIREQLDGGIRYLDLRIVRHAESGKFYTCHGVYCVDMDDVIREVNDFLNTNKREIVLLDINHLFKMDGHDKELIDPMLKVLGDKVADFTKLKPKSKVGDFWKAGAQVVILYCGKQMIGPYKGKLWSQNEIRSPWPNATDVDILHEKLKNNIETRDKDKFFVLQGLLTPDGNLIKEEILANNVNTSLESISKRISCRVVNWVENEWSGRTQNVVIVDFYEKCSIVPIIIHWNKAK